jgi:hypothetical protein
MFLERFGFTRWVPCGAQVRSKNGDLFKVLTGVVTKTGGILAKAKATAKLGFPVTCTERVGTPLANPRRGTDLGHHQIYHAVDKFPTSRAVSKVREPQTLSLLLTRQLGGLCPRN